MQIVTRNLEFGLYDLGSQFSYGNDKAEEALEALIAANESLGRFDVADRMRTYSFEYLWFDPWEGFSEDWEDMVVNDYVDRALWMEAHGENGFDLSSKEGFDAIFGTVEDFQDADEMEEYYFHYIR